jgi:hypothetical protein
MPLAPLGNFYHERTIYREDNLLTRVECGPARGCVSAPLTADSAPTALPFLNADDKYKMTGIGWFACERKALGAKTAVRQAKNDVRFSSVLGATEWHGVAAKVFLKVC